TRGVDVGLRQNDAAEQRGDLFGIDFVGFGFAAVDGLHVQGVSKDEGDLLLLAEVGEPVPGEHAFTGNDEPVAEGANGLEEGGGAGGDGVVEDDGAGGVEDAERKGSRVEIDAAVESVLLVVKSHHGLRVRRDWLLVTPVYLLRRGHDEYPGAASDRDRNTGFSGFKVSSAAPAG